MLSLIRTVVLEIIILFYLSNQSAEKRQLQAVAVNLWIAIPASITKRSDPAFGVRTKYYKKIFSFACLIPFYKTASFFFNIRLEEFNTSKYLLYCCRNDWNSSEKKWPLISVSGEKKLEKQPALLFLQSRLAKTQLLLQLRHRYGSFRQCRSHTRGRQRGRRRGMRSFRNSKLFTFFFWMYLKSAWR